MFHPQTDTFAIMTLQEFGQLIDPTPRPVILLEGRREIPAVYRRKAAALARRLATHFPGATFRSGNATGSDETFSSGVAKIDPARLHLVAPTARHRTRSRFPGAVYDSLDQIDDEHRQWLAEATIAATPANRGLIRAWLDRPTGPLSAKAAYLVRDTLKVLGIPGFIPPATTALFHIDPTDPEAGGTGHTIRVCGRQAIPVLFQETWAPWTAGRGDTGSLA